MSADDYMKKADGKANAMFFKDLDGAYDYYVKAGGCYKADRQFRQAGDAFMKAGDTAMRNKSFGDAQQSYAEAAKLLKKVDMKLAGQAMDQAIKLNIQENRLGAAARLLKEWGEALEADEMWPEALAAYDKSRQYFETEDQAQAALQVRAKMASLFVELRRFDDAMLAYEKLGRTYAEGSMKFQAKSQFFMAIICRLATIKPESVSEGCAEAHDALEAYLAMDGYFRNTREADACEMLIGALETSDEVQFDEAIGNLQELKMLDDKKTTILLKVRENVSDTK